MKPALLKQRSEADELAYTHSTDIATLLNTGKLVLRALAHHLSVASSPKFLSSVMSLKALGSHPI